MENQYHNISNTDIKKYNPFEDGGFWAAILISLFLSAQSIFLTVAKGTFQPTLLVGLVLMITWSGWIVNKRGEKRSFLVGFAIAIVFAGASYIPLLKIAEKRNKAQIFESMEKRRQQDKIEVEKSLIINSEVRQNNDRNGINSGCPAPYHILMNDGRCLWSCNPGSTPGSRNECVCQPDYVETGKDKYGRRLCELKN